MNLQYIKNQYLKNGYVRIGSFFDPDYISKIKDECDNIYSKYNKVNADKIQFSKVETHSGSMLYRIDPIQNLSNGVSNLIQNQKLNKLLEDLFEEKSTLLKDKIIYKPPGARGFPAHQDYSWSEGLFPLSLYTVIIPLEEADKKNGAVSFYKGYHHELISNPKEARHFNNDEVSLLDKNKKELLELNVGDIVIFSGLTPHESERNLSSRSRMQVFLSYNLFKDGDHYDRFLQHFQNYSTKKRTEKGEYKSQ